MKTMLRLVLTTLLVLAVPAHAVGGWVGPDGQPVPDSDSRQSKRGFSGHLLITSDQDWRAKWDTPSDTTPEFTEAGEVRRGGELTILIFFANPKLDAQRNADVRCDIQVVRPDGSLSADEKNLVCYQGTMLGNALHVYLAAPVVSFLAEPDDQAGEWIVKVTLRDDARHVSLPLRSSFTLVE